MRKPNNKVDPENGELTDQFFARAKRGLNHVPAPLREALKQARRGRGPQRAPTKELVSIRLDPVVLENYRRGGNGWQSRLNEDLVALVTRRARATKKR